MTDEELIAWVQARFDETVTPLEGDPAPQSYANGARMAYGRILNKLTGGTSRHVPELPAEGE